MIQSQPSSGPLSTASAASPASPVQPAGQMVDMSDMPTPIFTPTVPAPSYQVRSHGLTDRGKVRSINEDNFLIAELTKALRVQQSSLQGPATQYSGERGHLFVVADGMGGHAAGEQASALAVHTIEDFVLNTLKWFFHLRSPEQPGVLSEFQQALRAADARIFDEAARHPEYEGMGTTLTMAYTIGRQIFIIHVGDSRCYLLRGGQLYKVTHDHSLVEEMVQRGHLTAEEAAHHRWRHVITNVVGGTERGIRAEAHRVDLDPNDTILLCSDGLTEMLKDDRLAALLLAQSEPRLACEQLVREALEAGGRDNVTVIVANFQS